MLRLPVVYWQSWFQLFLFFVSWVVIGLICDWFGILLFSTFSYGWLILKCFLFCCVRVLLLLMIFITCMCIFFFVNCIMFASRVIYKLCVAFKTFYCCLLRLNWCVLCWYIIIFFLFGIVLSSTFLKLFLFLVLHFVFFFL